MSILKVIHSQTFARKVLPLLLLTIALVAGAYFYFMGGSAVAKSCRIYIPTGSTYGSVVDSLKVDGRINSVVRFNFVARVMNYNSKIRGGSYLLDKGTSYFQLVRILSSGAQRPIKVAFNNIRTLPQLSGRLAQQMEADSAKFLSAITNDSVALRNGLTSETMAIIFIPNTYEVYWNTSPTEFVVRMKREFDKFWNDTRKAKLTAIGFTAAQVVTLASIVYEETKKEDDMARIAGVYINRLHISMALQADPTLKFAIGDFTIKRVLNSDKKIVSPYNTYMYNGLPPGPICMPSIAAVDAVLNYEKHDYLYFCARPDFSGYHSFARTLAQHNANSRAYSKFLNDNKIFR